MLLGVEISIEKKRPLVVSAKKKRSDQTPKLDLIGVSPDVSPTSLVEYGDGVTIQADYDKIAVQVSSFHESNDDRILASPHCVEVLLNRSQTVKQNCFFPSSARSCNAAETAIVVAADDELAFCKRNETAATPISDPVPKDPSRPTTNNFNIGSTGIKKAVWFKEPSKLWKKTQQDLPSTSRSRTATSCSSETPCDDDTFSTVSTFIANNTSIKKALREFQAMKGVRDFKGNQRDRSNVAVIGM